MFVAAHALTSFPSARVAGSVQCFQLLQSMTPSFFCVTHQAAILGEVHHPHVLRMFGVSYHPPHAYIVTEQCWGSLLQLLRTRTAPTFSTRLQWALDIAYAMDFLHDRGIVHRYGAQ